jgi:SAM-dependent methyltransferase
MARIRRAEAYQALATVYQAAGLADYSLNLAPRLLELAFDLEWTGRTLCDLGCGTGDLARWYGGRSFRVFGLDQSAAMLAVAGDGLDTTQMDAEFIRTDITADRPQHRADLVTCLGQVLNYATSLRELETALAFGAASTEPGKLFIFDLLTIGGLARTPAAQVVADNGLDHLIVTRNMFSYETLTLTTRYSILNGTNDGDWVRSEEVHTLRGYPVAAVNRILEKYGLRTLHVLTAEMQPVEPGGDEATLLFVTQVVG